MGRVKGCGGAIERFNGQSPGRVGGGSVQDSRCGERYSACHCKMHPEFVLGGGVRRRVLNVKINEVDEGGVEVDDGR